MVHLRDKEKNINLSLRLNAENRDDVFYIKILRKHKEYGYATMKKLIAAALREYEHNHKDGYKSID